MIPMLMAGSALPPLGCPPDDVVAWLCFLLGFGLATFVLLVIHHIAKE